MILRVDRLQIGLPAPQEPDAAAAACVQELLGGRFGEMSTLMNYTYQSFNMRGRKKIKPFYDLVANIATEEYGHIELVSAVINGPLTGVGDAPAPTDTPLKGLNDADFKEAKPFVDRGLHARLYRFSPDDFKDIDSIWTGEHPFDGARLEVRDGLPEEGGVPADPAEEREVFAPGYHPEELKEIAER